MTNQDEPIVQTIDDFMAGRISRRRFIGRALATGLSLTAIAAVLEACAQQSSPSASAPGSASPSVAAASPSSPTPPPSSGPTPGGTLVFARQAEPASLLPCGDKGAADNASIWALPAIFDQLVRVKDQPTPQPDLATSWELAADGLSATFKLRAAKFSNGDPVTADDVAFSINRFIDPEVNSFYQGVAGSFKKCTVIDPSTVKIEMKRIDGAYLDSLAMFVPSILPKKYFESLGSTEEARQTKFAEQPIGSGPFMLKKWVRGQTLELVKNPFYWDTGKPYLDGITFEYVVDDNTRILKLTNGEAHLAADIPYNQIDTVNKTNGLSVLLEDIAGWKGIWFNNSLKPFDDHNVRLALNYATPKEAILKSVLYGAAGIANSLIASVKYTDPSVPAYPYDIAKATAAIAASSVPNGFSCSLVIVAGDAIEQQIAEILQSEWAKIGITIKIEGTDLATIQNRYFGMKERNIFTFPGSFLSSDTLSEDNLAFVFMVPDSGANSFFTNYKNDKVIALINTLSGSLDEATRKSTFLQIQQLSMADAPNVTMYFTKARTGIQSKVKGFRTQKTGWWKFEEVFLQS